MKCSQCGGPLPIQTGRGRRRTKCEACSPSRHRKPKATPAPAAAAGSMVAAVTAELQAVGMLGSSLGQSALMLAKRIDAEQDSGASLAQLVRQLGATMAAAVASAEPAEVDPVDELRNRRERRGA